MERPDLNNFAARTEDQKRETFEKGALDRVLKCLGWPGAHIDDTKRGVGPEGWNFDWFNRQGLLPGALVATRVFSYNLAEAFDNPKKSALMAAFWALEAKYRDYKSFSMIFKTEWDLDKYLIATTSSIPEITHIHVCGGPAPVAITHMRAFLAERMKEPR
jgi:hypothetical protein